MSNYIDNCFGNAVNATLSACKMICWQPMLNGSRYSFFLPMFNSFGGKNDTPTLTAHLGLLMVIGKKYLYLS